MKIKFIKSPKMPAKMLAVCVSASRFLALSLSLTLPVQSQAGIENDMVSMFNSMGAETNYTEGGAFHGQSGSLYTGGSLSVRNQVSNMSLGNIQLPSVNAGCGGIDIFGGSFSFVNKEQFIQFTRNLGNNAAGVAFDLALKALDPMIQDAIGGIRDLVNKVNNQNLNSCQMAQTIVGGVMGSVAESAYANCKASAVATGGAEDGSESTWYCKYARNLASEADKIRGTNKPQDTISFTGGNLTYEALKNHKDIIKDLGLGIEAMDFYYTLLGTAVFPPPTEDGEDKVFAGVQSFTPRIKSAADLLDGKKGSSSSMDERSVTIDTWTCSNGSKKQMEICSEANDVSIVSIRYIVKEVISALPNYIRNNTALTEVQIKQIASLVNNSRLPILRMAVADAFLGTNNLNKQAVIDSIAIDVVANILNDSERYLRTAINLYSKTDGVSGPEVEKMLNALAELRNTLYKERNDAMQKIEIERNMLAAISASDSQWRTQFTDAGNSLAFDQMNRL